MYVEYPKRIVFLRDPFLFMCGFVGDFFAIIGDKFYYGWNLLLEFRRTSFVVDVELLSAAQQSFIFDSTIVLFKGQSALDLTHVPIDFSVLSGYLGASTPAGG